MVMSRSDRRVAPRLSRDAWRKVLGYTAFHTLLAAAGSVILCILLFDNLAAGMDAFGTTIAALAPIVVGGPMIFYATVRRHQLAHAYQELEAAAARDSLTGCLNHGGFVDAVSAALNEGRDGALLVIDADHFKAVNDRFGHAVGDEALRLIAGAITAQAGPLAIAGRLGGEEFGVFVPGANAAVARLLGETIRAAIERLELAGAEPDFRLSVSVGGAIAIPGHRFGCLFRSADSALYDVKHLGRNGVRIASEQDTPPAPPLRVSA